MNTLRKNLTLSLLIFISLFLTNKKSKAQCHIDDWTALKALYESTNGDYYWTNNTNWEEVTGNAPTANCNLEDLYGVTLNGNGRVTFLSLGDNYLVGYLPAELEKLVELRDLKLDRNQLNGNIPAELGNLSLLRILWLYSNQLTGSIPPQLGNLSMLQYLWLQENQLTGNVPPEIGNLSEMFYLALNYNDLSGCYDSNLSVLCQQLTIENNNGSISHGNDFDATWTSFCNNSDGICAAPNCHIDDWTALKAIYENTDGDNWLNNTGWEIVTSATQPANCNLSLLAGVRMDTTGRVSELNLGNNWLNGSIPPQIDKLTYLTRLKLGGNTFTNIPPELGNLTNLVELRLNNCGLSSNIPPELGNLINIIFLFIENNQLTGNIPTELGNLSNMTRLYIQNNDLIGEIPVELSNASSLGVLYLNNNNLSGCYNSNLKSLCNQISTSINAYISDGNNFDADWQDFCASDTGTCSLCSNGCSSCNIDDWTALKAIYESTDGDNWLNNSGWETIAGNTPPSNCNLSSLYGVSLNNDGRVRRIELDNNQLGGSLPPEIGDLSALEYLYMQNNNLSGNIPPEIGNINVLDYIYLQNNNLSGSIPNELANIYGLTRIKLNNNQLTGVIPNNLDNNSYDGINGITVLHLHNNQLTGIIPSTLGNIITLAELRLENNQLIGSIPASLGNPGMFLFNQLRLNNNNLSACYESSLKRLCTEIWPNTNESISDGNNFDAAWEDFCASDAGLCLPCPSDLVITATTPFQNEYQSANTITTDGSVIIDSATQVEYKSNRVTLNEGFSVKAGAQFRATYGSCE